MFKRIMLGLMYIVILIIMTSIVIWYQYTQKYVQDSEVTASTGIFLFTKTLNLKQYKRVANGRDLWGKYDRYSRSDRHEDVLTIYCGDYCSVDKEKSIIAKP